MEKDEAARAPETIKEKVKPDSELFDDAVKKADYEAEAEKIMSDNPKMGQNAAKQNVLYYTTEEANSMFFEGFDDGLFRKSPKMSQKEAREKVANMAEGKSIDDMARQFIGMDYGNAKYRYCWTSGACSYALDCIEAELVNIKNKHGKR